MCCYFFHVYLGIILRYRTAHLPSRGNDVLIIKINKEKDPFCSNILQEVYGMYSIDKQTHSAHNFPKTEGSSCNR